MSEKLEKALEVENITKIYGEEKNGTVALHEASFTVSNGEFAAIVGPSGSGKSTLLNIIGALDRPSSGRVLIDGSDLSEMTNYELANLRNEKIGFVFQSFNLIQRMTAAENIALPMTIHGYDRARRRERALALLEEFGIGSKADNKPGQMSGGEQQRVAVARALANNPSIILADEPTGNLDTRNSQLMMGIFERLNLESRKTIVMITHNMELAAKAKKIIAIRDGMIAEVKEN